MSRSLSIVMILRRWPIQEYYCLGKGWNSRLYRTISEISGSLNSLNFCPVEHFKHCSQVLTAVIPSKSMDFIFSSKMFSFQYLTIITISYQWHSRLNERRFVWFFLPFYYCEINANSLQFGHDKPMNTRKVMHFDRKFGERQPHVT